MKKTKDQKIALVSELSDALRSASSTVFVGFKGLNVAEETAMRRALKAESVKYTVAKKTLIRRVLEALGHKAAEAELPGEVALAYGLPREEGAADSTAPARLIHEFGKKFLGSNKENKLSILGGIFEGILMGKASMEEIATIPPMQTLRAMFAQVINSPRQRFAVVLSKVAEKK
ncbi:50S ribosomal protein L10 [Candidatus Kaiserbacteria bacterium]|nr:50S ribosomal protein L10 [Candidatus Kaiserbacteria bacterium]